MTIRSKLFLLTAAGLCCILAGWGWWQVRAINRILEQENVELLNDVARTIGEQYLHFGSDQALAVLDSSLRDLLTQDATLARVDLFFVDGDGVRNLVGVSRIGTSWPTQKVREAARSAGSRLWVVDTDAGPALGLLVPLEGRPDKRPVVGAMVLVGEDQRILTQTRRLFLLSGAGLMAALLGAFFLATDLLIQRPLHVLLEAMEKGRLTGTPVRVPLRRRDEWGLLADRYNRMVDETEAALERNRELTRGLEARVHEATLHAVQLQARQKHLERLSTLGFLAAQIAHDMGTPLHSIAGLTDLLLEDASTTPEARHKLERIAGQAKRLDQVLQNVRRTTRLPDPSFARISAGRLFEETLPLVEPALERAGIALEVRVAEGLSDLFLDAYRIQTALLNLIQNAMEAMPSGGTLTLAAFPSASGPEVVLEVGDTGPGIPDGILRRVFEPFFSTRVSEGVKGLGLSIVHDIVKIHGGRVEVDSAPGRGARMRLYLPSAEGSVPAPSASASSGPARP